MQPRVAALTEGGCNPSPHIPSELHAFDRDHPGCTHHSGSGRQYYEYVNAGEGMSGGGLSTTFAFRFLEADGTTPVQAVAAAPEPSTWGSLAGGLAALAFWKRRRAV
jgi:hypothetical protein